jgi:hypothetical protein
MAQSQLTSDEKDRIINMFESMDAKPKLDNQDDLEKWMSDYLATKGESRMTMQRDRSTDDRSEESIHKSTILHKPKITSFSGNDEPKGISYATWRYEVDTLLREGIYTKLDVEIAAKKSLRGGASDVVRRMGIHADLDSVMYKLSCIYGVVEDSDSILKQFYGATQRPGESVASWGCRLEDLLDRANKQEPIRDRSVNDMLLNRFWSGLRTRLKEAARSKTEHIHDYERLLVEVRKIESESDQMNDESKGQVRLMSSNYVDKHAAGSDEESLRDILTGINARLHDLEIAVKSSSSSHSVHSQPHHNSSENMNYYRPMQTRYNHVSSTGQGHSRIHDRGQGHSRGNHTNHRGIRGRNNHTSLGSSNHEYRNINPVAGVYRGTYNNSRFNDYPTNTFQQRNPTHTWTPSARPRFNGIPKPDIICHRCRQPGHIAARCQVDLESLHLNMQGSA